jgi:hypothetical protein
VRYPRASSDPHQATGLLTARRGSQRVVAAAADAQTPVCISVVGRTDPSGAEARNTALSEARARAVAVDLAAHGVRNDILHPIGRGAWIDAGSAARARSATFDVDVGCRGEP